LVAEGHDLLGTLGGLHTNHSRPVFGSNCCHAILPEGSSRG
jgi:hypothetical protein